MAEPSAAVEGALCPPSAKKPERTKAAVEEMASPGHSSGGLLCQKCRDPTTMSDSYGAGSKNPLLRICTACSSTDR
eukprot:8631059-Pyramimonas_sp.AAC.1